MGLRRVGSTPSHNDRRMWVNHLFGAQTIGQASVIWGKALVRYGLSEAVFGSDGPLTKLK